MTLILLRPFSSRGYDPSNSTSGDSVQHALNFIDENSDSTKVRTSNGPESELPKDDNLNSNPRNVDNSNNVPLNKGNIAQVQRPLEKDHPSSIEEKEKEEKVEYPERGIEIRPKDGELSKRDSEVEPNSAGIESQEVDSVKIDGNVDSKHEAVSLVKEGDEGEPGSHLNDGPSRARSDDSLYVRSSMPIGPALKMPHTERQRVVVDAIKHAWSSYKKYAWGEDDLLPLSKSSSSFDYGMAMTMIDSLDTLWLAGLQEEFNEARNWIAKNLRFDTNTHKVIVFEVNIRVVGGLLSAYHLTQDKMFLEKAVSMCKCVCVCV